MEEIQPGSALFIEFYEVDGKDLVRVFYKKSATAADNILYDNLDILEFQGYVNSAIAEAQKGFPTKTNLLDWCKMDWSGEDYNLYQIWSAYFFKYFKLPLPPGPTLS